MQTPRKPLRASVGVVGQGADTFSSTSVKVGSADPQRPIRSYTARQVAILETSGVFGEAVEDLHPAIELALAKTPRGVVCDLTTVLEGAQPGDIDLLAKAGRHVHDWPGIPVAVACADPQVGDSLGADALGAHLIVTTTILQALSAVLRTPTPAVEWLHLAPHPTAPRAARDFVTRTLLGWGLGSAIPTASLVVSELVTNSTVYAGTKIELSIAWDGPAVRLTVRDGGTGRPRQQIAGLGLHGRGLTIVSGLSRGFGFLPTDDGGKVVWAVLVVPLPSPLTGPEPSEYAAPDQELPLLSIPILQEG
ncbi:MAG: ATP-binding protein [Dermatophilaceae bacterium]